MKGAPLHILLVEDNPDHAELIQRNFADCRIVNRLSHVDDGEQALDYLHARGRFADRPEHYRPDLILLDLRLPRVDGLEVLKQIKSDPSLASIPTIILTTSAAERDVAKAYEYRANSYLTKPVGFVEFSELLRDLGFYWLAWNQRPY